jgi:mRNA-degrading endonuclease RelE of RelBE toxin-antitoxin system
MCNYTIKITRAVFRHILKLHNYFEDIARVLTDLSQGNLGDTKKLRGYRYRTGDLWRTKRGDIRVIWRRYIENNHEIILVIAAGLRRDIYQNIYKKIRRDVNTEGAITLAELLGIEETRLEHLPTYQFDHKRVTSWYQFVYGGYLYSPLLTPEQQAISQRLITAKPPNHTPINSFLLQSAPGTGKTVCAALIACELFKTAGWNVALIVPEALRSDLEKFTEIKSILQEQDLNSQEQSPNFFLGTFKEWLQQAEPNTYAQIATDEEELTALQQELRRVHIIDPSDEIKYRDLVLFRAFVLNGNNLGDLDNNITKKENKDAITRVEGVNINNWKEILGDKKNWLDGLEEITKTIPPPEGIRTLLIFDEAQDYLMAEIEAIKQMLLRWHQHNHSHVLWLLGDMNQRIKPTGFDWGQLQLNRKHKLTYNYRNTRRILEFANIFHSFAQAANLQNRGEHLPHPSDPKNCFEEGEPVRILECKSPEELSQVLSGLSKRVRYTSNQDDRDNRSVLQELSSRVKLIHQDIAHIPPEDQKPGIDYLKVTEAKGREFDACVAFSVFQGQGKLSMEEASNLYTIFTRPRYRLLIITRTDEIKRIGRNHFNQCQVFNFSDADQPLAWITEFANGEQVFQDPDRISNLIYERLRSQPLRIYWDTYAALRAARFDNQTVLGIEQKAIEILRAPKKDESQKDESQKDESQKDESQKDESQKDESQKDESQKDESQKDEIILQELTELRELEQQQPSTFWSPIDIVPLKCLLLRALGRYWDAVEEISQLQESNPEEYRSVVERIANELEQQGLIYEGARVRMRIGEDIPQDYPFRDIIAHQHGSIVSVLCQAAINQISQGETNE